MKSVLVAVSTACVLSACGPAERATEADGLHLELLERFGSVDGVLSFRQIEDITLTHGSGDTLLVSQAGVPALLMLDSSGDSLGMIGREGSGPGEFSAPLHVGILADTIWVQDVRGPVLRFDARGRFIDQLHLQIAPLGPFQYPPRFRGALPDGSLLMQGNSNPVGREAGSAVRALAYVRVSRDGFVRDTVALLAVRGTGYVLEFSGGGGIVGSHPAAESDVGDVDPRGRWVIVAAQVIDGQDRFGFTVRWIGVDGDTLAVHHVSTTPVSAEAIRDDWIERLIASEGRPRGAIEAAANDVAFPDHQAPASRLFADLEGRAWVRSPHSSADSTRWYLLDPDRGPLGSLVLEKPVELLASRGDVAWGWTRGSYDEPYVLKFVTRR